ncbi:MAG: terminase large subunit domain-containing protein [Sphingomonas oligoaromativorans]
MRRDETHTAADLARLPDTERARMLRLMPVAQAEALRSDWRFWARPEQLAPDHDDWRIWLLLAGRGFGKTRAGAEWMRSIAETDGGARIALVGSTLAEARAVMVEGESGLLAIAPDAARPVWEPSLRRLTWPNGAIATLYSAAEPESLRGPQHSHGWCDEIAKWPHGPMAWDNLMLGLRLGERPRVVATTTPRPVPLVRALVGRGDVAVTGGRSVDNRANLPPDFLSAVEQAYGGTRFGRQELDGELIEEVEGALWSRELIERCQARALRPPAPAALTATREANGSIQIGWTRRSRIGWDWLDDTDAPLAEESERYRLTAGRSGPAPLMLETAIPSATLSAADLAGLGQGALLLSVAQVGTSAASLPPATFTLPLGD